MLPDLELLMELQSVDREIARLTAEIAALPKYVAEIESRLQEHAADLERERGTLTSHYKERKGFEQEIKIQREKIAKYRDQTAAVKTNEQYRALQHEIDYAEAEIRKFEDRVLETMVFDEGLEANVKAAQVRLDTEKVEVAKESAEAAARTREDEAALAARRERRATLGAELSPEALKVYDFRMRTRKNLAICAVIDGACTGCRVKLRQQALNEVRANDALRLCESCGRIIYYHVPAET